MNNEQSSSFTVLIASGLAKTASQNTDMLSKQREQSMCYVSGAIYFSHITEYSIPHITSFYFNF